MAFIAPLETLLVSPGPSPGLVVIAGLGLEPKRSPREGGVEWGVRRSDETSYYLSST